ncbi:MAG: hypothetical protein J3K34DRAFT_426266 [Monoraphidium minutum]|nr:MAG: hypothetical protein J3K34DRAFT_426266 [Monoraphidium minutum]
MCSAGARPPPTSRVMVPPATGPATAAANNTHEVLGLRPLQVIPAWRPKARLGEAGVPHSRTVVRALYKQTAGPVQANKRAWFRHPPPQATACAAGCTLHWGACKQRRSGGRLCAVHACAADARLHCIWRMRAGGPKKRRTPRYTASKRSSVPNKPSAYTGTPFKPHHHSARWLGSSRVTDDQGRTSDSMGEQTRGGMIRHMVVPLLLPLAALAALAGRAAAQPDTPQANAPRDASKTPGSGG